MKYKFSDINNENMYKTARVMFIAGPYSIFNNRVADRLKNMCRGSLEATEGVEKLMEEFVMSRHEYSQTSSSLDFTEFLEVVNVPAVTGKWFCSVDYKMLTKKHKEALDKYIKKPSENGVLVVIMTDYQDYRPYLKNRSITANAFTHLIQLSFPYRSILISLVKEMMIERGVKVADKAVELFVLRMSRSYDEYPQVLDRICRQWEGRTMTYNDMSQELKGIENYVLEDFLEELVNPIKNKRIVTRRKIYRMLNALLSDMGPRELALRLRSKISDLIEMRILINTGVIPIRLRFSVPEAKSRLDEDHKLKRLNDYTFRRYAEIASKTSLRDWVFMQMILNNVEHSWNPSENAKAIYALVHRAIMSESRLMNDIGITNILEEQLYDVNSAFLNI